MPDPLKDHRALLDIVHKLAKPLRVSDGAGFKLKDWDPADTGGLGAEEKPLSKDLLQQGILVLSELQQRLFSQDCWAVLLIFQAMDAAGKDGAIRHVMSGIDPAGCQVFSFKAPSAEELDHDYMWRCMRNMPERGRIGIFNRSYYEEVLIVKVHQHLLQQQKIPPALVTETLWHERYEDIRHIERYLSRNGVLIRKFFLNVSKAEQKKRFLERLDNPDKHWKFSAADAAERDHWDHYMAAYQDMIRNTATDYAPWYVVPADNKWFTRIAVASVILDSLAGLDLRYPELDEARKNELRKAREGLQRKE